MAAGESVAGRLPVSAGTATCAVMIDLVPASIAARNGTSSRRSQQLQGGVDERDLQVGVLTGWRRGRGSA